MFWFSFAPKDVAANPELGIARAATAAAAVPRAIRRMDIDFVLMLIIGDSLRLINPDDLSLGAERPRYQASWVWTFPVRGMVSPIPRCEIRGRARRRGRSGAPAPRGRRASGSAA